MPKEWRCDCQLCPSSWCATRASKLVLLDHRSSSHLSFRDTPAEAQIPARIGFLDLPREIRDHIYTWALVSPDAIFAGVVALERHAPHHWHTPAALIHQTSCELHDPASLDIPEYADLPHGLTTSVLAVCHQLHKEGAHILYGSNTFVINIRHPAGMYARSKAEYDPLSLELPGILPFHLNYQSLLRRVTLRDRTRFAFSGGEYFNAAMLYILQSVPGAFIALRTSPGYVRPDEVSAGWCPSGMPSWLSDKAVFLGTPRSLNIAEQQMTPSQAYRALHYFSQCSQKITMSDSFEETRKNYSVQALAADESGVLHVDQWYPVGRMKAAKAQSITLFLARFEQEQGSREVSETQSFEEGRTRLWLWKAWVYVIASSRGLQRVDGSAQYTASTGLTRSIGRPLAQLVLEGVPENWFRRHVEEPILFFLLALAFNAKGRLETRRRRWNL